MACNREYQARLYRNSPDRKERPPRMSDEERKRRKRIAYQANREVISEIRRSYYHENRDKVSAYERERIKRDPIFALSKGVRARVRLAFVRQGYPKNSKTEDMLGCDYRTLADHIERQFMRGMTWENRGNWHIDHIIPLASAKTKEEVVALCHFTNLRPMWALENISKGAKQVSLL